MSATIEQFNAILTNYYSDWNVVLKQKRKKEPICKIPILALVNTYVQQLDEQTRQQIIDAMVLYRAELDFDFPRDESESDYSSSEYSSSESDYSSSESDSDSESSASSSDSERPKHRRRKTTVEKKSVGRPRKTTTKELIESTANLSVEDSEPKHKPKTKKVTVQK